MRAAVPSDRLIPNYVVGIFPNQNQDSVIRLVGAVFAEHSAWVLATHDGREYLRIVTFPFRIAREPIRPIEPGSPISAVRVETTLEADEEANDREFRRWGILDSLVQL